MMMNKENIRARAQMYRFLSRFYRVEADVALLEALKAMRFPAAEGILGEGYAQLEAYLKSCGENAVEELAVDYARVFLAAGSADGAAAVPCESIYLSPAKIFMQEPWEAVCREYEAHGLAKGAGFDDLMEDHIALELEFMAFLAEKGDLAAQKDFLEKHLLNWVEGFAADIEKYAKADFYKAVGHITLGFLRMESELLAAAEKGDLSCSRSFSVRNERMSLILARLREHYHVYAPKRETQGGDLIRYGEIDELTDIVYKEKSHFSPEECFHPASQTISCTDDKGIIIICRPCDISAMHRREKLKIILLECAQSFDGCTCVSTGSNRAHEYSAAMRIDDICALMEICDEELLPYFADEVPIEFTPEFVKEN